MRLIVNSFTIFLILLSSIITKSFCGQHIDSISFKTAKGDLIKICKGTISYNNKTLLKLKYDDVLYQSKSNRIIEDHGVTFLFIATAGNPNLDTFEVYSVSPNTGKFLVSAILSPVKDYDADGYLEFGGSDLTEVYPNPDSMYYIPTAYYKIKYGKILPDKILTKKMDIKLNGLYLTPNHQLDENKNCCRVIRKPTKKIQTR